jgi:hypothetical protein
MSEQAPSNDVVSELRKHAKAWGVSAQTPDEDVFNETAMARECARAANEIERLHRDLEHMADMQLTAAVNRPAHEPRPARCPKCDTEISHAAK